MTNTPATAIPVTVAKSRTATTTGRTVSLSSILGAPMLLLLLLLSRSNLGEAVGNRTAEAVGNRSAEAVGNRSAEAVGTRSAEAVGTRVAEAVGTRVAEAVVVVLVMVVVTVAVGRSIVEGSSEGGCVLSSPQLATARRRKQGDDTTNNVLEVSAGGLVYEHNCMGKLLYGISQR